MSKLFFIPLSIGGSLLAGLIAKKTFEAAWGVVDKNDPPGPEYREVEWSKLLVALALEGAIFKATRGALDHAARTSFYRATGAWPGDEQPEPT